MKKLKAIKIIDIIGIYKFLLVLIPSIFYKIYLKVFNKELWLICEQRNTARDNGYYFFKYMVEKQPQINTIYAIDYKSPFYNKVKEMGKVVNWGSIKHYFYYMSATKNISSHKEGNPNHLLFTILHLYLNLYNNRVFLQHGIIKDDIPMFYYENTKFKGFICGAKKEYEYIKQKYGYRKNEVAYTGLARYDNLDNKSIINNQILIIPTWRNWLGGDTNFLGKVKEFEETDYFKNWNELLQDNDFINFIEKNNINVLFYPHVNMQKYIHFFKSKSNNIKIVEIQKKDIQELLKESALMITDYSSVYFDFAYMKKPLIYYQFDYAEYRSKQLQEGYFDYKRDGFGPVVSNSKEVVNIVIDYYKDNSFKGESKFENRVEDFFERRDKNNCERIYNFIKAI